MLSCCAADFAPRHPAHLSFPPSACCQRYPTTVLRLELERELDRLLLGQVFEREQAMPNELDSSSGEDVSEKLRRGLLLPGPARAAAPSRCSLDLPLACGHRWPSALLIPLRVISASVPLLLVVAAHG